MKNIQIPEPCHENWADFTPTQKGAFCGSCQIDVVDFSDKSPDQVKSILKENSGQHMCGRFKKSQLEELNNDFYAWDNQSTRTFQSKFLYACLVVFGMTLFTSCNLSEHNFLSEIGVEQNDASSSQLNMTAPEAYQTEEDTNKVKNNNIKHIKGKVAYTPPEEIEEPLIETICTPSDTTVDERLFTKGEIYIPDARELENTVITSIDTTEQVIQEDSLYDDMMVDGEIMWTEDFTEYVEDTIQLDQIEPDTAQANIEIQMGQIVIESVIITPEIQSDSVNSDNPKVGDDTERIIIDSAQAFESMLFPNPAKDNTTVVIQVNQANIFDIYLYAIDGKRVKSIYKGLLNSGRQEFIIDLSAYKSGSYLIVVNSESQKESLRLEKVD